MFAKETAFYLSLPPSAPKKPRDKPFPIILYARTKPMRLALPLKLPQKKQFENLLYERQNNWLDCKNHTN